MTHSTTQRRRNRTFTGCWTCRSRKVKCDEASPNCTQCQNLGRDCSGYQSRLVWVTSDQKKYKAHGRRFLYSEKTWNGYPILESDHVDALIGQWEKDEDGVAHVILEDCSFSPFSMLRVDVAPTIALLHGDSITSHLPEPSSEREISSEGPKPLKQSPIPLVLKIWSALSPPMPEGRTAAFLFHHYVNHIAPLMMPFEDTRNPWRCRYPAVALEYHSNEQKCLYRGMQAQAAFNLAQLRCDSDNMQAQGTNRYVSAMEQLRESIGEGSKDYSTFLAAAITLMMVEVYNGKPKLWRVHLKAAWNFFDQQRKDQPWLNSELAYISTQAICMIQTTSDSASLLDQPELITSQLLGSDEDNRGGIYTACPQSPFEVTMGVTKSLMSCISDIKRLEYILRTGDDAEIMEDALIDLYRRLTAIKDGELSLDSSPMRYHSMAFKAATLIYLYRSLFDLPPSSLQVYVSQVFCNLTAFQEEGGGVLSVWPAFIAAIEVYKEEDMILARQWLEAATGVGMGNRMKIKSVVEAVWEIRETTMLETGVAKGSIVVDWRDVMHDLDLDILLV